MKLRAVNDTTLDKGATSDIAARIGAQASVKGPNKKGSTVGSKKKKGSSKKVEKKESVKPRKKSAPLLAVVMGADPDFSQSITINPGEV